MPSSTTAPVATIDAWGIDTLSFAYRIPGDSALVDAVRDVLIPGCVVGRPGDEFLVTSGPSRSVLVDPVGRRGRGVEGGVRLGAFPQWGLLFIEGRGGAWVSRDRSQARLLRAREVGDAAQLAAGYWDRAGLPPLPSPMVRRVDAAVDLRFDDASGGLRFLKALACLDVPRLKTTTHRNGPRVETVSYITPKRGEIRFRAYDKGVQAGSDPPGLRIRLERQARFGADMALEVPRITEARLGELFAQPLAPWLKTERIQVGGIDHAQRRLREAFGRGELSLARLERLIGALVLHADPLDTGGSVRATQRRRKELRAHGISLDVVGHGPERLDIAPLLRRATEVWRKAGVGRN
jgi:hypothetical protein